MVTAVAEANRLSYGHLSNPAFATEISLIDPLPHQRIAVYERMLELSPLRFLLADDAGAGKTIMTGLYLREVLARRLVKRVLVAPPAGLVGNWEREMRTLFSLPFRIVRGAEARGGNPFAGPESDRVIVSVDTLAGERTFGRLREAVASGAAPPYDLVVFDEAHKLAARRRPNLTVDKLDEAIELVRAGRADELERRQKRLGETPDFETRTADEDAGEDTGEAGASEGHEAFEEQALGGIAAPALAQLREERGVVEALRLEGLGFTGQVASIHGGLD